MNMNIADHYWSIAGSTTQVYQSKSNTMVASGDANYVAWQTANGQATPIVNEVELADAVRSNGSRLPSWLFNAASFIQPALSTYSKDQLKAYASDARWRKEQGGITLTSGMPIKTDDRSQAKINGIRLVTQASTQWHAADGSFWSLDDAAVTAMSDELQAHINNCFTISSGVFTDIDAGTTTTLAQIDTAFA
jgi:hypothetical protein